MGRNPVLEGRFYIVFFFDYYRLGAGWLGVMRVLHFQRDNYRLKLPSPVRIVFCSKRASLSTGAQASPFGVMLADARASLTLRYRQSLVSLLG
jgi:hypothetical protein